jgi:hypothetical protein
MFITARCPTVNANRRTRRTATTTAGAVMKRFLIEREIPGASELTEVQLADISKKSNATVESLGVPYRWINSYVAGDKVYCIHEADDEDVIREHARRGGFPANTVCAIANEFGPHTADSGEPK